ncbi:MAG: hypothetical protein JXA13_06195 [Anaerolineales bacterium]|nr:hypothetical protein [Anaerolineales bacterium]
MMIFFAPNDSFCVPGEMHCGVPFETTPGGIETTYQEPPVYHFYVGNSGNPEWSVYWNGSGLLTHPDSLRMSGNKKYVKTDIGVQPSYYGHQFGALIILQINLQAHVVVTWTRIKIQLR